MEQHESGNAERIRGSDLGRPDYKHAEQYASYGIRSAYLLLAEIGILVILLLAISLPARSQANSLSEHAKKAQAAIAANNGAVAEEELRAILKIDPRNANAYAELGMLAFVHQKYDDASHDFETGLSISPSLWNARAFLGMCRLHLAAAAEGRSLIEKSLPHITDHNLHVRAGLELVNSYTDSGMIEKAEPILKQLEQLDPSNAEVLYAEYRVHSEMASEALRRLTASDKDSAWVHEILGQNYFTQEQYPLAIQEFRKAIERGATLSGLHYQLGEAVLAEARTEENRTAAEKEFRAELAVNPRDSGSLYQLGQIALERKDFARAKSLLLQALGARPEYADAHVALSKVYEYEGNVKNAITELEAAEKLAPGIKTTHYRLAQLYRQGGRVSDSNREMESFRNLSRSEQPALAGEPPQSK